MSEQLVITEQGATELLEIAQQGPGGPPGPAGAPGGALLVGTAGEALSGHQAVAYGAAGQLVKADAGNPSHSLLFAGVTLGAAAAGAVAEVQQRDVINFAGWTWVPNRSRFPLAPWN